MADVVLDASAVLAHLRDEVGAVRVVELIDGARLSAVNLAEVVQKLIEDGVPEPNVRASIETLPCRVVAFDAALGFETGLLRRLTRARGLSLGDRACLALARKEGLAAVTADRAWAELDLGVEVVLIR